jgi:hypothetical protein
MKDHDIALMNPERRGFLTSLAAVAVLLGSGLLARRAATPPLVQTGPRELSLQQVDSHGPHKLAG